MPGPKLKLSLFIDSYKTEVTLSRLYATLEYHPGPTTAFGFKKED